MNQDKIVKKKVMMIDRAMGAAEAVGNPAGPVPQQAKATAAAAAAVGTSSCSLENEQQVLSYGQEKLKEEAKENFLSSRVWKSLVALPPTAPLARKLLLFNTLKTIQALRRERIMKEMQEDPEISFQRRRF